MALRDKHETSYLNVTFAGMHSPLGAMIWKAPLTSSGFRDSAVCIFASSCWVNLVTTSVTYCRNIYFILATGGCRMVANQSLGLFNP